MGNSVDAINKVKIVIVQIGFIIFTVTNICTFQGFLIILCLIVCSIVLYMLVLPAGSANQLDGEVYIDRPTATASYWFNYRAFHTQKLKISFFSQFNGCIEDMQFFNIIMQGLRTYFYFLNFNNFHFINSEKSFIALERQLWNRKF